MLTTTTTTPCLAVPVQSQSYCTRCRIQLNRSLSSQATNNYIFTVTWRLNWSSCPGRGTKEEQATPLRLHFHLDPASKAKYMQLLPSTLQLTVKVVCLLHEVIFLVNTTLLEVKVCPETNGMLTYLACGMLQLIAAPVQLHCHSTASRPCRP